ncbi:hypothetical protein OAS39_00875 [Pirellulales bacterium]|nr:hypothetical protein [Pirellulales bacterium]
MDAHSRTALPARELIMGLFGFSKFSSTQAAVSKEASPKDIVARYRNLRSIRLRLNDELVHRLPTEVLKDGAKRIGILRGGKFVFDNEDETSVLMDYCIYDVYRNGRNAVEQYLCDSPPDPDSDEMALLHAMQNATFALVAVLRIQPGVGCRVRNLFTEETRLLVDFGFSRTAQPGAILMTRLLDFGDFVVSGGAALPLGILENSELDEWQRKLRAGVDESRGDPAPLIRAGLQQGASSHIRYEGMKTERRADVAGSVSPAKISAKKRRRLEKQVTSKPMANRRCKCGSGKMIKNCCGKR